MGESADRFKSLMGRMKECEKCGLRQEAKQVVLPHVGLNYPSKRIIVVGRNPGKCFIGRTHVWCPKGDYPWKHIQHFEVDDSVYCWDFVKDDLVVGSVVDVLCEMYGGNWTRILWEDAHYVFCTPEHKFMTPDGWVPAKYLKRNGRVLAVDCALDEFQRSIVLGMLMGESVVSILPENKRPSFVMNHRAKSFSDEFWRFLMGFMSPFWNDVDSPWSEPFSCFDEFLGISIEDVVDQLDFGALAVWYLDRGYVRHVKKPSSAEYWYPYIDLTYLKRSEAEHLTGLLNVKFGKRFELVYLPFLRLQPSSKANKSWFYEGIHQYIPDFADWTIPDFLAGKFNVCLGEAWKLFERRIRTVRHDYELKTGGADFMWTMSVAPHHNYILPGGVICRNSEDDEGVPFVNSAPGGGLLTKMLAEVGLTRDDVAITNACCCYSLGDRPVASEEVIACSSHLRELLSILKPKLIIPVGKDAFRIVTGRDTISADEGKCFRHRTLGCDVIPIHHPGYLLRNPTKKLETFRFALPILRRYLAEHDMT